jgi:hypothetical protein
MTKASTPQPLAHGWSKDALLAKAQRYAEVMLSHPQDDWRFAFWSTLLLELLARAALSNISPVLLADSKDWNNTYHALGFTPKATKFVPKSQDITSVLTRLREILSAFRPELEGFSIVHMSRRNEELHSGTSAFDGVSSSSWLPSFYEACEVLLQSIGSSLKLFLGKDHAKVATAMIAASRDDAAKAVLKSVQAHKTVWENKKKEEQARLIAQAETWATRHEGHGVKCPACGSNALVFGLPSAAPLKSIKGDEITETQQFLPTKFECVACGLKISGYSQLNACGLGDTYKATVVYDAADYYAPQDEFPEYEPDYNEP